VGAVATQSWANTEFGPEGLQLMGGGLPAPQALDAVLEPDADRDERQAGFVDADGRAATFTGANCMDWAGGVTGDGFAAQGNILAGEEVVAELGRAFAETDGDLCDRLLAALLAGDAAGGDRRGKQSAALLVVRASGGYEGRNDRYIDLRVDDHPEAPAELARLFTVWDDTMLIRNDEPVEANAPAVEDLQRRLTAVGAYDGPANGAFDDATRAALADWAGRYNLEGRLRDDGMLSSHLLMELRDITPEV
jgi:uncharacterized Ntn-hydrolase superfamily protein